jgi:hypothetical protein
MYCTGMSCRSRKMLHRYNRSSACTEHLSSIFLERQLMPVQCMQMTCYIYVASSWNESSSGAVHADDLLYLCSIFLELKFMPVQYMQMTFLYLCSILLERQLMPVQCMQMTCYIYVASSWNDSLCQCSACRWPFDITGHLQSLPWHELPFQDMLHRYIRSSACTALAWDAVPGRCYIDIKGHLHVLHWHELPFQEDVT